MTTNNDPPVDCLKLKREIQARIAAETAHMTTGALLDYFNNLEPRRPPYTAIPLDGRIAARTSSPAH